MLVKTLFSYQQLLAAWHLCLLSILKDSVECYPTETGETTQKLQLTEDECIHLSTVKTIRLLTRYSPVPTAHSSSDRNGNSLPLLLLHAPHNPVPYSLPDRLHV